jgi:excisionase family DNA binding protein
MLTRRFLTVKEVADLVQVSEASVRHWIKLRQLRAIDLGREWRVIPRDLEAFLATHETCRAANPPVAAASGSAHVTAHRSEAASKLSDGATQARGPRRGHSLATGPHGAGCSKEKRDAGA